MVGKSSQLFDEIDPEAQQSIGDDDQELNLQ
jgi:hypothetical protein